MEERTKELCSVFVQWEFCNSEKSRELAKKFVEEGLTLDVLEISKFDEIKSMLTDLNQGEVIKFKRKFETLSCFSSAKDKVIVPETQNSSSSTQLDGFSGLPQSKKSNDSGNISTFSSRLSPDISITPTKHCSPQLNVTPPSRQSARLSRKNQLNSVTPDAHNPTVSLSLISPERSSAPKIATKRSASNTEVLNSGNNKVQKALFTSHSQQTTFVSQKKVEAVRQLIQKTPGGALLLSYYERYKKLNKSLRSTLCRTLIYTELEKSENKTIPMSRLNELSLIIKNLFPTELVASWYTPFFQVGVTKHPAGGKLVDAYHNARADLIRANLTERCRKRIRNSYAAGSSSGEQTEGSSEDSEKSKKLRKGFIPFETASEYWQDTVEERLAGFGTKYKNVNQYFDYYPLLKKDSGVSLLKLDFEHQYKDKSNNFIDAWPSFKDKLLERGKDSIETELTFIKNSAFLNIDYEETDEDLASVNALRLLAFWLANCRKVKGTKKVWPPSKGDMVDGFLLVIPSATDVKNTLEAKRKECEFYGLTLQPLPVVVLDQATKSCSSYVCINGILYTCSSPVSAFDTCFKVHHALDTSYPPESRCAWTFVQVCLYGIRTKYDALSVTMTNFAQEIGMAIES